MLTDLRNGLRDAVICYHVDRLTRRPVELEQFVATVDAARVRQVRFVAGDMDLGTGDGLLIGRIMAAVAANESAAKSRRVRRKLDQLAAEGRPHGGYRRPFGYEADKVTVRPDEAAVIRQLVARYLAGGEPALAVHVAGGRERPHRRRRRVAQSHAPRPAALRADRRAARAPRRGDRPRGVGGDHHPGRAGPRVGPHGRADGHRPPDAAPLRPLRAAALRTLRRQAVRFPAHQQPPLRLPVRARPQRRLRAADRVAEPLEQLLTEAVIQRLNNPELAHALTGRGGDAK
jgi:site-specific DNA recombinase